MRAFEIPPGGTFPRITAAPQALIVCLLIICLINTGLAAQAAAPRRKVAGHTIITEGDPSIRVELPQAA